MRKRLNDKDASSFSQYGMPTLFYEYLAQTTITHTN